MNNLCLYVVENGIQDLKFYPAIIVKTDGFRIGFSDVLELTDGRTAKVFIYLQWNMYVTRIF